MHGIFYKKGAEIQGAMNKNAKIINNALKEIENEPCILCGDDEQHVAGFYSPPGNLKGKKTFYGFQLCEKCSREKMAPILIARAMDRKLAVHTKKVLH